MSDQTTAIQPIDTGKDDVVSTTTTTDSQSSLAVEVSAPSASAIEPPNTTSETIPSIASTSTLESSIPGTGSIEFAQTSTTTTTAMEGGEVTPTRALSKNAQKKLAKLALRESTKVERRQEERTKRKLKNQMKKTLVAQGKLDPIELLSNSSRKRKKLFEAGGKIIPHGAKVVIDLEFDDLMIENEIKSMGSQLNFCYSANRNALRPFELIMTGFGGRLKERLEGNRDRPHEHWKGVRWMTESYTNLYETSSNVDSPTTNNNSSTVESSSTTTSQQRRPPPLSTIPKESFIYLSGDSPNILSTISPDKTYILGGIVDRNRYKNLCLNKAEAQGISHAQLPIGEYLAEMPTRKILTVNQVYEIMVKFVECDNWEQALREVIPLRKMSQGVPGAKKTGAKRQRILDETAALEGEKGVYVVGGRYRNKFESTTDTTKVDSSIPDEGDDGVEKDDVEVDVDSNSRSDSNPLNEDVNSPHQIVEPTQ